MVQSGFALSEIYYFLKKSLIESSFKGKTFLTKIYNFVDAQIILEYNELKKYLYDFQALRNMRVISDLLDKSKPGSAITVNSLEVIGHNINESKVFVENILRTLFNVTNHKPNKKIPERHFKINSVMQFAEIKGLREIFGDQLNLKTLMKHRLVQLLNDIESENETLNQELLFLRNNIRIELYKTDEKVVEWSNPKIDLSSKAFDFKQIIENIIIEALKSNEYFEIERANLEKIRD